MTLTISISPESEAALRRLAQEAGLEVEPFAAQIIDRVIRATSADVLLAPFRAEVAASGFCDEELDEFFERLRSDTQ